MTVEFFWNSLKIVKLKKLHRHLSYNLSILISRSIYNKNIEMYRIICPWSQSREGFWIWKKQRKSWRQNYFPLCHQRINCCRWRFESRNQKTFRNRLWLGTFLLWRSYKEIRYVCRNFTNKKLIHVIQDFCPWDVTTKVRYFLMVQIDNLRTL